MKAIAIVFMFAVTGLYADDYQLAPRHHQGERLGNTPRRTYEPSLTPKEREEKVREAYNAMKKEAREKYGIELDEMKTVPHGSTPQDRSRTKIVQHQLKIEKSVDKRVFSAQFLQKVDRLRKSVDWAEEQKAWGGWRGSVNQWDLEVRASSVIRDEEFLWMQPMSGLLLRAIELETDGDIADALFGALEQKDITPTVVELAIHMLVKARTDEKYVDLARKILRSINNENESSNDQNWWRVFEYSIPIAKDSSPRIMNPIIDLSQSANPQLREVARDALKRTGFEVPEEN